jgi:hypothetical protein
MSDVELELGTGSIYGNDNSSTVVLVFYKSAGDTMWQNDMRNFDRVPVVGEYLTMARDGDWYEVKAVVHMAFPLDYDAELYCVKVEDHVSLRRSFGQ